MPLLFSALKNWALQVHVVKDNSILRDVSIWALSVFLPLAMFWISLEISTLVLSVVGVVGLLVTTVVYIRIYVAVQRHKNQIQTQQVQEGAESGEMANFASLIKSAVGVFYVYLVFLICYLPFFIGLVAFVVNGPSLSLKRFSFFLTDSCLS